MTISSQTAKVSYAGNGSTKTFAVPFYFLADSHLKVILRAANGTETVKTLTTDYAVTGAGNPSGGTVTMNVAPTSGTTLVIVRNVPLTQETDYQANDPFPAESHERALDKLTMENQGQQLQIDRAVKFAESDATNLNVTLPTSALRAKKAIVFDESGNLGVSVDDYDEQAFNAAESATAAHNSELAAASSEAAALASEQDAASSEATALQAKDDTLEALAQAQDGYKQRFVPGTDFTAGVTTTLTLTYLPAKSNVVSVYIGGVYQETNAWSLVGKVLTFTSALPNSAVEVHYFVPSEYVGLTASDQQILGQAQASAQASATTATTQASISTNQAVLATSAKTSAEAARDAAQLSGGVYADTAAGIAATTNGKYFSVPSPVTSEYLILYQNSSGSAVEVKRYPSVGAIQDMQVAYHQSGVSAFEGNTASTIGDTSYDTASTGNANFWSPMLAGAAVDTYLTQLDVRVASATTGSVVVVSAAYIVISDTAVTIPSAGVNTLVFDDPIFVPTGARVFLKVNTNVLRYTHPGSGSYSSNFATLTYSGVVGDEIVFAGLNVLQMAIKFYFRTPSSEKLTQSVDNVEILIEGLKATSQDNYRSTGLPTLTWAPGVPSIAAFTCAYDGGADIPAGAAITDIGADIIAITGADAFRFMVMERDTSVGDTVYVFATSGTAIRVVEKTPADLGLVLDAAATKYVTVDIDPILVRAGKTYFVLVECWNSTRTARVDMGLGQDTTTDTRQRVRGWWKTRAGNLYTSWLAIPSGSKSSISFEYQWVKNTTHTDESCSDLISSATAIVSGTDVSIGGVFYRNGVDSVIDGSQTLALTTGSNIRYDTIYHDAAAGTLGIVTGSDRTIDPSEAIPAIGDPKRIPLFNCRVTSSAIETVPVWSVDSGEQRTLAEAMEKERRRSRLCLPKTLAKIRRGAALKVASMGDSILAIQNTGPSKATPNGANRDRTFYFSESIASDIVNTYPLYTAVQLGWADDGAGAVHIAQSYVWQFVMALRATGQTVSYDNFAVGSTNTTDAVDGSGNPWGWLTAVIALAPDLVVLNFGMNERGNTGTETRMVQIIGHLKAAGVEVIVNGCPRPASNLSNWEFTNRALERAARYTNVAFVSMMPLYDARYIGAIGCATIDASSANRINHPGLREHQRIGQEYIKLLMGAA